MERSTDHILTTHTGSLPRPADFPLDGTAGPDQVRRAVDEIVQAQLAVGLDVVNDGETNKRDYATYVTERLTGFGGVGELALPMELEEFPEWAERLRSNPTLAELDVIPACIGPVRYVDTSSVETDIANLNAATADRTVTETFLSAASPGVVSLFLKNQHYPSDEEYISDVADAMKTEYDAIYRSGITLQIDCPDLAMGWNVARLGGSEENFVKQVAMRVEALNHATRDIPPEAMRLHLCWGNYEGPHHHDIPLRVIIGEVLKARPVGLSFEGANPRHAHEWRIFEDVKLSDGKVLIPGVVDSTTHYIEHPELVAQRIENYARLVGTENVIAGTDCGFSTFAKLPSVDPRIAWAKLGAMAAGARIATDSCAPDHRVNLCRRVVRMSRRSATHHLDWRSGTKWVSTIGTTRTAASAKKVCACASPLSVLRAMTDVTIEMVRIEPSDGTWSAVPKPRRCARERARARRCSLRAQRRRGRTRDHRKEREPPERGEAAGADRQEHQAHRDRPEADHHRSSVPGPTKSHRRDPCGDRDPSRLEGEDAPGARSGDLIAPYRIERDEQPEAESGTAEADVDDVHHGEPLSAQQLERDDRDVGRADVVDEDGPEHHGGDGGDEHLDPRGRCRSRRAR